MSDRWKLANRARSGEVQAMYDWGEDLILQARNAPDIYSASLRWFERAAERGNTEAMAKIGNMCLDVENSERARKGIYWSERAALAGNVQGQLQMYEIYLTGSLERIGIPKDPIKAEYWKMRLQESDRLAKERIYGHRSSDGKKFS